MSPLILVEPDYVTGAVMTARDYAKAQDYQIAGQREGSRSLVDWGVVEGLTCLLDAAGPRARIAPGMAIDGLGRLIVLAEDAAIETPPAESADVLQGKTNTTRLRGPASASSTSRHRPTHRSW